MTRRWRLATSLMLAAWLLCGGAAAAGSQSVLERSPNVSGGWLGDAAQFQFNFVHRFNHSGAPERQVQNRPTFLLAYTTPWDALAGVHYVTRSALVAGVPNEWELFVRARPFGRTGKLAPLALQLGYNAAARSVDAEASAAAGVGPLNALAAVRALSAGAAGADPAAMVALALLWRVSDNIAVAADGGRMFAGDRITGEDAPWGVALQLRVPTTPHTVSLHATNTDAATLQSASRGSGFVRWGFEFTVPITPARFRQGRTSAAAVVTDTSAIVRVSIHNLRYQPDTLRVRAGTVVEWHNRDPLEHTVTSDSGLWDSGLIQPDARWSHRFDRPGEFGIVCTPHPFMRAVVIVQ